MPKSEIFNLYAKLAEEKGLVKKAESKSKSPKSRTDISAIEALYGVKPNGKDDDKIIMEHAHPNAVIIAPSYDKLNGLVENNIERQNIIVNMISEENHGIVNQEKYAQHELLMALVRTANDLDAADEDELRALADHCIEQASIKKEAFDWQSFFSEKGSDAVETSKGAAVGAVVGGILGAFVGGVGAIPGAAIGGALGGIISSITKTAPQAQSVAANCKDSIEQLEDLIKKDPGNQFFQKLRKELREAADASEKYLGLFKSESGLADGNSEEAKQITSKYIETLDKLTADTQEFEHQVDLGLFKPKELHWYDKIRTAISAFMDDDVQDVQKSFQSLNIAIKVAKKGMDEAKKDTSKAIDEAKKKEEEAKKKAEEEKKKNESKPAQPHESPKPSMDNVVKDIQHESSSDSLWDDRA